jgi:hypothetical protein
MEQGSVMGFRREEEEGVVVEWVGLEEGEGGGDGKRGRNDGAEGEVGGGGWGVYGSGGDDDDGWVEEEESAVMVFWRRSEREEEESKLARGDNTAEEVSSMSLCRVGDGCGRGEGEKDSAQSRGDVGTADDVSLALWSLFCRVGGR